MYDVSDSSDMILKSEIKQQYDIWSKENGLKPMKMGILYGALDDKFGKSVKCQTVGPYKSKWVYRGLKVKVEEPIHDLDM
jgi:hypothetical protein